MRTALALFAFGFAAVARADQEAGPTLHVASGGAFYAKCIPAGSGADREQGKTLVYLAGKDRDELLYSFDWFAQQLYVTGRGGGVSLVRLGAWPRGRAASAAHLAIAFYANGKLLKRYSTLDLSGTPQNVEVSVSHYQVIREVVGFVEIFEKSGANTLSARPDFGFEILLHDGRRLVFNTRNGEIIPLSPAMFTRRAQH